MPDDIMPQPAAWHAPTPAELAQLRQHLLDLRFGAVCNLAQILDAGHIGLLADADAAIAALDRMPVAEVTLAERVVVTNADEIRVTAYTGADLVVSIAVSPIYAMTMAAELIEAAQRRLVRTDLKEKIHAA